MSLPLADIASMKEKIHDTRDYIDIRTLLHICTKRDQEDDEEVDRVVSFTLNEKAGKAADVETSEEASMEFIENAWMKEMSHMLYRWAHYDDFSGVYGVEDLDWLLALSFNVAAFIAVFNTYAVLTNNVKLECGRPETLAIYLLTLKRVREEDENADNQVPKDTPVADGKAARLLNHVHYHLMIRRKKPYYAKLYTLRLHANSAKSNQAGSNVRDYKACTIDHINGDHARGIEPATKKGLQSAEWGCFVMQTVAEMIAQHAPTDDRDCEALQLFICQIIHKFCQLYEYSSMLRESAKQVMYDYSSIKGQSYLWQQCPLLLAIASIQLCIYNAASLMEDPCKLHHASADLFDGVFIAGGAISYMQLQKKLNQMRPWILGETIAPMRHSFVYINNRNCFPMYRTPECTKETRCVHFSPKMLHNSATSENMTLSRFKVLNKHAKERLSTNN